MTYPKGFNPSYCRVRTPKGESFKFSWLEEYLIRDWCT